MNAGDKDLIIPLYLIALSGGSLWGRTRLQKLVFLSQKAMKNKVNYNFTKARFGPLSYDLYSLMENLISMGFVNEKSDTTRSGNEVIIYKLTNEGKEFLDYSLDKNLSRSAKKAVERVHSEYGNMPLVNLLDKVHKDYPHYVEKVDDIDVIF
jgi:uncharacterized protein YwgA